MKLVSTCKVRRLHGICPCFPNNSVFKRKQCWLFYLINFYLLSKILMKSITVPNFHIFLKLSMFSHLWKNTQHRILYMGLLGIAFV